jgi:hypothetical protein
MDNGFNIVDFMDLPGFERCIVRFLLRETELTYPQLVESISTLPDDQQLDQEHLDAALDHLTRSEWIVSSGEGEQRQYRISLMQRNNSHQHGMLDGLELESIDRHGAFQVDLEPAATMLSVRSGGKRALPKHVWDCLTDPAPEERSDTTAAKRTGSLNSRI